MITYYYSDPLPNTQYGTLDGNNHVIADPTYRQSTVATSTPTLDSPTKTGTVCPDANHYTWLKEYKGTSFQGGNDKAFYVYIKNTQKNIGTTQSSGSVEYRSNNTSNWTIAKDIDGQDAKFGMIQTVPATFAKVRYIPSTNNSNDTNTLMTLDAQRAEDPYYLQPEDYGVTVTGTVSQGISGARIFAFNGNQGGLSSGEYRITLGNFHGTNLSYPSCVQPPKGNGEAQQKIQVGDANYGQVDQSKPASSYPYRVSKNAFSNYNSNLACGNEDGTGNRPPNFGAIEFDTAYAREFIAKYVTQFYTDEGLTTELTLTTGLHSFGRVGTQSNIESTLNGLYQAVFNSAGLRVPSLGNPSIACTLDPPGGGGGSGQPVQSIQFVLDSIISAQINPIAGIFPGTNLENVSWNISGGGIDSSGTTFPIDFSQNTGGAIFTVFASNFSSAAKRLDMGGRGVTSCDISALTNVEEIFLSTFGAFSGGGVQGPIDLSGNVGLKQIVLANANIGSIDFTNNVNIERILANSCNLTEIKGLNGKTSLKTISATNNNLTTLDLSTNTSLEGLRVNSNNLSLLNIQNGNNLNWSFVAPNGVFAVSNNPNLTCVTVDANAVAFANTNFTSKDSQTFYSGTTCP